MEREEKTPGDEGKIKGIFGDLGEMEEKTEEKPKKKMKFLDLIKKKNRGNDGGNIGVGNGVGVGVGSVDRKMDSGEDKPLKRKETENVMNVLAQYNNPILMNMGFFLNPNGNDSDNDEDDLV